MLNVTISLGDGYIKQNNQATVYVICRIQRKKVKFNTGISIGLDHWDHETNRIKTSHPKAKDYNLIIAGTMSRVNDIFIRYRLMNRPLTSTILKKEYLSPSQYIDFFHFMSVAIEERKGELTETSMKQHRAAMAKLKEFRKELSFVDIDADLIKKFNRWLINTKKNSQNTRHNTFKTLKAYLNIAIDKKLIETNPLNKIPVSRTRTDPTWLTEEELNRLIELYRKKFLPPGHHKVLRHFLFSCVTGLRISDLKRIEMDDISGDRIIMIPFKVKNRNSKTVKIPLCTFAKQLIKDESPHKIHGRIFDMFSEPVTRLYIKEVFPVAKIEKDGSFHTSRHTFATLFLKKTKNLLALRQLLGHSRIEETMVYSHILAEEIDTEMESAFGNI